MFAAHATKGVAASVVATTINPSDKASNITLSGGDLTWTNASSQWGIWRSTNSTTAKVYAEITIGAISSFGVQGGFANSSATASPGTYLGANSNGVGYVCGTGAIFYNGSGSGSYATLTVGDVLRMCMKPSTGVVWFAKNSTWQNGDPDAETGGFTAAGLGGTIYASGSVFDAASSATVNFGATAFAYSVPSGVTPWA